MERARIMGSDRDAALRRVAIVLSSLPAAVSSQLLSTFDADSIRQLRHAMTSLVDVDPLERRRALQAFKGSLAQPSGPATRSRQQSAGDISDQTPIDTESIGLAAGQGTRAAGSRVVPSSRADQPGPSSSAGSLAFLSDVDDETLVGMLHGEHPQAIALVLASIAPVQAARILPSLDTALQGDALSRIGRLGEIPNDVVEEIASHLRKRIKQAEGVNRSEAGQRALGAILAAMPQPASHRAEPSPAAAATAAGSTSRQSTPIADSHLGPPEPTSDVSPIEFAKTDLSAVDQTHRLRLVTSLWPEQAEPAGGDDQPCRDSQASSTPSYSDSSESDPWMAALASTDSIHQHLLDLAPEELCQALGAVTTRQAILSLCGLPNEIAQAVLAVLPRSQAKQVRRGMASLQSLELREIDEAKEAVAAASIEARRFSGSAEPTRPAHSPARMAA